MANVSEVTDSMINRFLNNLPTVDGVPLDPAVVKTPNAPFKTPKNSPWVRLSVLFTEATNVEPGGEGRVRYDGIMTIDCFVPTGTGNKVINELQVQATTLYARKEFENIRSKTVTPTVLGRNEEDSNWYQNQIVVDFEFDDC